MVEQLKQRFVREYLEGGRDLISEDSAGFIAVLNWLEDNNLKRTYLRKLLESHPEYLALLLSTFVTVTSAPEFEEWSFDYGALAESVDANDIASQIPTDVAAKAEGVDSTLYRNNRDRELGHIHKSKITEEMRRLWAVNRFIRQHAFEQKKDKVNSNVGSKGELESSISKSDQ